MFFQSLSVFKMLVIALALILSLAPQSSLAHNERAAPSTTPNSPAATHSINVGAVCLVNTQHFQYSLMFDLGWPSI
jgi:hypothetical protein